MLGFLGDNPENVALHMPSKKPKGKGFTDEQKKEENRKVSSVRVVVEHTISSVKRCRIVKECFRCRKFGFDDLVMELACDYIIL